MKTNSVLRLLMIIFLLLFMVNSVQAEKKEISKTFKKMDTVDIHTVSGDCIIRTEKSSEIKVQLVYDYSPGCFNPEFREEGSTLVLEEHFSGSCSGSSVWKLVVPETTRIKFKSASGDFSADGLKADLSASTASGDFEIENISGNCSIRSASGDMDARNILGNFEVKTASGDFDIENIEGIIDIRTASGDIDAKELKGKDISIKGASSDIELKDSSGTFSIKTASGDVQVKDIVINGNSEFKTASGEVHVKLARSSEFNLTLATASGDAVLDYGGNPIFGYFEFTAKEDDGRIESPFKFDKEEAIYNYGQKYLKKSFTRKSGKPVILIKTASGKAALEE
jgi:DUF4097 and DUF4098 domain-containing protein YvlB